MEEIKIRFPEELKTQIEEHPEIDWSSVFKNAIAEQLRESEKIEALDRIKNIVSNSKFIEVDANRLGELAKNNRLKELKSKGML